jgi:hypothetical protein
VQRYCLGNTTTPNTAWKGNSMDYAYHGSAAPPRRENPEPPAPKGRDGLSARAWGQPGRGAPAAVYMWPGNGRLREGDPGEMLQGARWGSKRVLALMERLAACLGWYPMYIRLDPLMVESDGWEVRSDSSALVSMRNPSRSEKCIPCGSCLPFGVEARTSVARLGASVVTRAS